MIINTSNLESLFTGFNASFLAGFDAVKPIHTRIALQAKSSTSKNIYPWMGQIQAMREWIGSRILGGIAMHNFTIVNRDYESTIAVPRNAIQDDEYGVYAPLFQEMGKAAGEKPDEIVMSLLANGFSGECYDGQSFFDEEHPIGLQNGEPTAVVSNIQAGSGAPWFLLDCSRPIKPLVWQERMPFNKLTKLDRDSDQNVFFDKEYIYGTEGRGDAGYGLWQLAYASKADLTAANFELARIAMAELKGDEGRPLAIKPTHVVVPPSLVGAARRLFNNGSRIESVDTGSIGTMPVAINNEWAGEVEVLESPWLA